MPELKSIRRYQELNRIINRVDELYAWKIINSSGESSFETPKEFILNFFRCWYELKENLKNDFPILKKEIENEISLNSSLGICIDIANHIKHWKLDRNPKINKRIWEINTHLHILDQNWKKDRTEMTIEIDNDKTDCLVLLKKIKAERDNLLIRYWII